MKKNVPCTQNYYQAESSRLMRKFLDKQSEFKIRKITISNEMTIDELLNKKKSKEKVSF